LCFGSTNKCFLQWLLEQAKTLAPSFENCVLAPLWAAVRTDDADEAPPTAKSNLKSAARAQEKAILEYNGDFGLLKDLLRSSIVCQSLEEVERVWKVLQQLAADGVVEVSQVKNRFRGKPMMSGYRDINANLKFKGHLCEVQIHCMSHYALKAEQHPVYVLCRTYGLVGELHDAPCIESSKKPAPTTSRKVSLVLHLLRYLAAWHIIILSSGYCYWGFFSDIFLIYDDYKGWLRQWKALSVCLPYW
jgi:hypothetical protein